MDKASKYRPAQDEDLSYRELKIATWYVSHKVLLQKAGFGALVFWSLATMGYSGFRWVEYFIFDYRRDFDSLKQQAQEFEDYTRLQPAYEAKELRIERVQVFRGTGGKYDFVAEAVNPNERWIARVRYKFIYNGGETEEKEAVFMPGASQPIAALGQESPMFPAQPRLEIVGTAWRRINPHAVYDVAMYLGDRLKFEVDEFSYANASRAGLPAGRLEFTLVNNSAYGYWQADFFIMLYEGGALAGVAPLSLDQFRAGEVRRVDWRVSDSSVIVTNIEAIPVIDVFDESEFMEPSD